MRSLEQVDRLAVVTIYGDRNNRGALRADVLYGCDLAQCDLTNQSRVTLKFKLSCRCVKSSAPWR